MIRRHEAHRPRRAGLRGGDAASTQDYARQLYERAGRFAADEHPDYDSRGLGREAVAARVARGEVNVRPRERSKTTGAILRDNIFTYFNFLNFVLALAVLVVALPEPMLLPNLSFFLVAIINTSLAVVQELRARRIVEKLTLLSEPRVTVIRDGALLNLPVADIVVDDLLQLESGRQIPVDALVLGDAPESGPGIHTSAGEVDEALQTGEADLIRKRPGELLLSGSTVVSGALRARAIAVGPETFAARIAAEARADQRDDSLLMRQLDRIVRASGYFILPLGVILVLRQMIFGMRLSFAEIIVSTVANLVSMIPEGLMLLTSMAFAVSVITLSKRSMMARSLASIEGLARVDVLCLDKTGTITTGDMDFVRLEPLGGATEDEAIAVLRTLSRASESRNATQLAIDGWLRDEAPQPGAGGGTAHPFSIPFSSARKWCAVAAADGSSYYQGAPGFLMPGLDAAIEARIDAVAQQGYRVLLLATSADALDPAAVPAAGPPDAQLRALALVVLADRIRSDASETMRYFEAQGVEIKIVSGDNPATCEAIATRVDIPGANRTIDMSQLDPEREMDEVVRGHTVFGRVSPFQKRLLVDALQAAGHNVAMTGDGVNDVLAMSRSDCGVAMAAGSDATRTAARLVLLDNNLAAMVDAVYEGRRVINNIRSVATLFLVKSIYATLMAILMLVAPLAYPLYPIQGTLISSLTVGIPAFFLALKPNHERVRGSFFGRVLPQSLPSGLTIVASWILIQIICHMHGANFMVVSTLSVLSISLVGFFTLVRSAQPLDGFRGFLIAACSIAMGVILVALPRLFHLQPLQRAPIPQLALPVLAISYLLYFLLRQYALVVGETGLRRIHRRLKAISAPLRSRISRLFAQVTGRKGR